MIGIISDYGSGKSSIVELLKNSLNRILDLSKFKYKNEKHPARKVFQAIRIEVNNELEVFESSLKQALELINVGGRICVITFHSLEDKICKRIFKEYSELPSELRKLPIVPEELQPKFKVISVIDPSLEEIESNKRSRSAKLRVIERIKE